MLDLLERNQARWLALALACALSAILAWLLTAEQFSISSIQSNVYSDQPARPPLSPAQLRDAIGPTDNVFLLNSRKIVAALVNNPAVGWAVVDPKVSGSVNVGLQPTRAVANWSNGGRFVTVGPAGQVVAEGYNQQLHLVIASPRAQSDYDGLDPAVLHAGHLLRTTLPTLGMTLAHIEYSPQSGIVGLTSDGVRLYVGPPLEIAEKLTALATVVDHARRSGQQPVRIDLRPVEFPTYRTEPSGTGQTRGSG